MIVSLQYCRMIDKAKRNPLYHQVADVLRSEIREGMQPGDKLPTEPNLADRFHVSLTTVKQALRILADEGWIERAQGRGTFVREAAVSSKNQWVALLTHFRPRDVRVSGSLLDVLGHELTLLQNENIPVRIYAGRKTAATPGTLASLDFPDFWEDLEAGCIRGVILNQGALPHEVVQRLCDSRVPVVGQELLIDHPVMMDFAKAFEDLVERLLGLGRRKFGLVQYKDKPSPFYAHTNLRVESFRRALAQHGLEDRPEWIVGDVPLDQPDSGGEAFRRIWERPGEKPDALILHSEWYYKGVMRAACQHGIDIPGDLVVAVNQPEQMDLIYPRPTLTFKSSSRKVAERMCSLMVRLLNGERVAPGMTWIPFDIVEEPDSLTGRSLREALHLEFLS